VEFDDSSKLKGIENLETILLAIKQERDLEFTHYNFHRNTFKKKKITPIIIKEYINRWYVIGVPNGETEIRTYGIERISNIELGKISKLKKEPYIEQTKRFSKIIGLNYSQDKMEKVVLKISDRHKKYLESLPIHNSQNIIPCKDEGFWHVTYNLIPNYEFTIEILKMSIETEVLEPKWYRDKVKNELKKIVNKYND
jgi:predicted DNA-binding transcriptional regulator YafY